MNVKILYYHATLTEAGKTSRAELLRRMRNGYETIVCSRAFCFCFLVVKHLKILQVD